MNHKEKLQHIKTVRMVNKWLHQNSPKKCHDALGIPLSTLTVVQKSVIHHGVTL